MSHRRKVEVHNSNYFTDTLKILLQYKIHTSSITGPIVYGLLQWIQRCITEYYYHTYVPSPYPLVKNLPPPPFLKLLKAVYDV